MHIKLVNCAPNDTPELSVSHISTRCVSYRSYWLNSLWLFFPPALPEFYKFLFGNLFPLPPSCALSAAVSCNVWARLRFLLCFFIKLRKFRTVPLFTVFLWKNPIPRVPVAWLTCYKLPDINSLRLFHTSLLVPFKVNLAIITNFESQVCAQCVVKENEFTSCIVAYQVVSCPTRGNSRHGLLKTCITHYF